MKEEDDIKVGEELGEELKAVGKAKGVEWEDEDGEGEWV